ncbi:MAG: hypothetical protein P8P30_10885 [Rickettsiales bacterium]|nr:hypothetical protein [Rickettsiales bacterium]
MNNRYLCLLTALFLAACASPALELPPVSDGLVEKGPIEGIPDDCEQISTIQTQIRKRIVAIETEIASSRQKNQALGYFSGWVPPLAAMADYHEDEKIQHRELQMEMDALRVSHRRNECHIVPAKLSPKSSL